ncbi:MAG: alginate lyase family protein, partial [Clostridia bacterium]|nr:alginate lyase family protein [Clostridia bacterium]
MTRKEQFLKITAAMTPCEKAAEKYAAHLEELFDVLVSEKIGEEFAAAVKNEDYAEAVRLCAAHYRSKQSNFALDRLGHDPEKNKDFDTTAADKAVDGYMREVNVDWHFPDGDIDFLFDATAVNPPVNNEWVWQLNRHSYWYPMLEAYQVTGDEKYAAAFARQMTKWVAQTELPENWNGPLSAWRTIECGIRLMGSWAVAFNGFRTSPSLSDVQLLLMIASMHRQSVHLVQHPRTGNWLMMESTGVFTFSLLFNELVDSQKNREIASNRLLEEMEKQILPDGMHDELSPDYQSVVLNCAANFYSLAQSFGLADELPPRFAQLIEKTIECALWLSAPGFTQPRTNDTYTIPTARFANHGEKLFGPRPEYRYVTTERAEGHPPVGESASKLLPWAGFAVMRSGWDADATYLCFDVGALGMGHMHQDKLNINIYKGDQELIFDDGGGQYDISDARNYALSGYGHNVAMVDGMAQHRKTPLRLQEPVDAGWVCTPEFDYAVGEYDETFSFGFSDEMTKPAVHKREVRFCKPGFYCVKDTLSSADGACHDYSLLFHLDTDKLYDVPGYKNALITKFGKKYEMLMIPLDEQEDSVQVEQTYGQTEPLVQGWYNGRNESYLHKAVAVTRGVKQVESCTFTTLFFPVEAGAALPEVTRNPDNTVTVVFEGKEYNFSLDA